MSLLNEDQQPAVFWITNPDNDYIGNRAVASANHGFWMRLPNNPTGPSATNSICPIRAKLGTFTDNVAHSNGENGLFIWEVC
jgi:hypothetical protein